MTTTQQQLSLTIDGKAVTTTPGKSILQAALDAGIYIPYLCYYPNMKPYGACRTCVVEVEDQRGRTVVKASCTEPCAEGMVVDSQTATPKELRRDIVELLMTEHPHGCLTCHRIELCGPQDVCQRHVAVTDRCTICPKNERCELKDTVRSVELDLRTPLRYFRRNLPIHADDPFYDRDYNLCIVCARCVRVCDEVRFDNAITLTNRSGVALVGTSHGVSLLESGCEFCGACIDVCPTGALVERDYKWEKATREVSTICSGCPVGCRMVAEVNKLNKIVRFKGDLSGAANAGQACFKGKFGYDWPNHKRRLKAPQARGGGALQPTNWDDALQAAAAALAKHGPGEVAVVASARLANEDAHAAAKLAAELFKTPHMVTTQEQPRIADTMRRRLGSPFSTNPIMELEGTRAILAVNANPTENQNVLAVPLKRAVRGGAKLVVIDSRETELTRVATEWLCPRPSTEPLVVLGIIKVLFDEALMDKDFLQQWVEDSSDLRQAIWEFDTDKISTACDIDETAIRRVARLMAGSGPAAFVFGDDNLSPDQAEGLADAVVDLAVLTGNLFKPSSGIYPLYNGVNQVGIEDAGFTAPPGSDTALARLLEAINAKRVKALVALTDGLNLHGPQAAPLLEAAGKCATVVATSAFANPLTELAHFVLPTTTYAEQEGTLTNLEGRVQKVAQLWPPKHHTRPNWEILGGLARAMGRDDLAFANRRAATLSMAIAAGYGELDEEQLEREGVLVNQGEPESPEQLKLVPVAYEAVLPEAPPKHSFLLAKGRVLHQAEPLAVVQQNQRGMNVINRTEVIHIHPADAKAANIKAGDRIGLQSNGETVLTGSAALDGPQRGVLHNTALFAELIETMQAHPAPDGSTMLPLLVNTVVTIQPL